MLGARSSLAWSGGRFGHIALFGTGLLNLAFALTTSALRLQPTPLLPSVLFAVGAVTMPAACFLVAWRKPLRRQFLIPVLSLIGAAADFLFRVLRAWEG